MSLFNKIVDQALANRKDLASLRVVVEKELLHHDILRVLSEAGMLAQLTFMGGTCLRACYGSNRLSEDLDFTGGAQFDRSSLSAMAQVLVFNLHTKYGLDISVSEPTRDLGNIDTWKLKVQTRASRKDLPSQRINIDICAIPSYQTRPMLLKNAYGVEMGTSGLILQVESREEIFTDKLLAFALRPNRIKYRDLWDIAWLHQQGVRPEMHLLPKKLYDHHRTVQEFLRLFEERYARLNSDAQQVIGFEQEMQRFLAVELITQTVEHPDFWEFLVNLMHELSMQSRLTLSGNSLKTGFQL